MNAYELLFYFFDNCFAPEHIQLPVLIYSRNLILISYKDITVWQLSVLQNAIYKLILNFERGNF